MIHIFTKTPPTQGSRKVVWFMQNEPQFILYRAQRTNVNITVFQFHNYMYIFYLTKYYTFLFDISDFFRLWTVQHNPKRLNIGMVDCCHIANDSILYPLLLIIRLKKRQMEVNCVFQNLAYNRAHILLNFWLWISFLLL